MAAYGLGLVPLPVFNQDPSAKNLKYDDTATALGATNVQDAIVALDAAIAAIPGASTLQQAYDEAPTANPTINCDDTTPFRIDNTAGCLLGGGNTEVSSPTNCYSLCRNTKISGDGVTFIGSGPSTSNRTAIQTSESNAIVFGSTEFYKAWGSNNPFATPTANTFDAHEYTLNFALPILNATPVTVCTLPAIDNCMTVVEAYIFWRMTSASGSSRGMFFKVNDCNAQAGVYASTNYDIRAAIIPAGSNLTYSVAKDAVQALWNVTLANPMAASVRAYGRIVVTYCRNV